MNINERREMLVDNESDITAALSMALVGCGFEIDSYNDSYIFSPLKY